MFNTTKSIAAIAFFGFVSLGTIAQANPITPMSQPEKVEIYGDSAQPSDSSRINPQSEVEGKGGLGSIPEEFTIEINPQSEVLQEGTHGNIPEEFVIPVSDR